MQRAHPTPHTHTHTHTLNTSEFGEHAQVNAERLGAMGVFSPQHHALCSYLVTAEGGAPPLRAIPPPRGGYRTRLQDQAPTSPSRWGDGSGEGGGVGQQPLAVTPLVLTTLNQPHVKQLLQQMQSSSRSIMCGARRAITSHMEVRTRRVLPLLMPSWQSAV